MSPDLLRLTGRYSELVKWAGLAESLADMGVSEDVARYVMQAPKQHIRYYMPALKENPQMSLPEIQAIETEEKEKFDPYLADERETAATLPPLVAKWYLVACRKLRRSDLQMRTMNDYEYQLYTALQNKIDTIASLAPVFGTNLPNLSVEQVLAYADTIGSHAEFLSRVSNPQLRNWFIARLGDATEEKFNLLVNNLQKIKDWATFARVPIPDSDLTSRIDISRYSIPAAVEASDKWHEEQAKAGDAKVYDPTDPQSIVFAPEHWNGWNLQIIRSPNDLKVEGNLMNHCVGSYTDAVSENRTVILSLRDPSNLPHVTVEMQPNLLSVIQEQAKGDTPPKPKYAKMLQEFYNYVNNIIYDHPELAEKMKSDLAPFVRTGIREIIPDAEIDEIIDGWRHWRTMFHGTLRDWQWAREKERLNFNNLIRRVNPKMLPKLLDAGFISEGSGASSWDITELVKRLPVKYLERFIYHPNEDVREAVAEKLPPDQLPNMLKDESNSVRSLVVDRIDESYLRGIMYDDPDDGVGYEAARRLIKEIPPEKRKAYVQHPNVRFRTALAGLLPEEDSELLLKDSSEKVRGQLAGYLPQEKLHLLANDPSPHVRSSVADAIHYINEGVSEKYIDALRYRLIQDKDEGVRESASNLWDTKVMDHFFNRYPDAAAIMYNDTDRVRKQFSKYAPPLWANKMLRTETDLGTLDDLVERATPNAVALFYKTRFPEVATVPPAYSHNLRVGDFLQDGDSPGDYSEKRRRRKWKVEALRAAMARHIPEQYLPDFINDKEVAARVAVAKRVAPEYLPKLMRDKEASVRIEVARRQIPAIMRMMWKDSSSQIRQIVAEHVEPDTLRKMVKDKDPKVRTTARKRLIQLNQMQKAKGRAKERRARLPRAAALYCDLCKG